MKLIFKNNENEEKTINELSSIDEIDIEIKKFLDEHNYKNYSTRVYGDYNRLKIDFGCDTEFFYVEDLTFDEYREYIYKSNKLNIDFLEKPVIVNFIKIDGKEYPARNILGAISEIEDTATNDRFGDYSLRDYEIYHIEEMDALVKLGLVKNYTGSRMANLYCVKDKEKLIEYRNMIYFYLEEKRK